MKNEKGLYNPLAPSKAAFYSAIFPGMGQVYNKKYWKIPLVWGAIGGAGYYYYDLDQKRFYSNKDGHLLD